MVISWSVAKQVGLSLTERQGLLAHWQWFLGCCERFHLIAGVPKEFSSQEGSIQERRAVMDGDDCGIAAEHNLTWRTQELKYSRQGFEIRFFQNVDSRSEYIQFSLMRPAGQTDPKISIKLRLSASMHGEAYLDCPLTIRTLWIDAITARTGPAAPSLPLWVWVKKGATVVEDDPVEGVERHYSRDPLTSVCEERIVDCVAGSPDRTRTLTSEDMERALLGLRGIMELRLADGKVIYVLQT